MRVVLCVACVACVVCVTESVKCVCVSISVCVGGGMRACVRACVRTWGVPCLVGGTLNSNKLPMSNFGSH